MKLFSINFEFKPEFVLSGGLGLIQGVDMVRDGSSLSLPILPNRSSKLRMDIGGDSPDPLG